MYLRKNSSKCDLHVWDTYEYHFFKIINSFFFFKHSVPLSENLFHSLLSSGNPCLRAGKIPYYTDP